MGLYGLVEEDSMVLEPCGEEILVDLPDAVGCQAGAFVCQPGVGHEVDDMFERARRYVLAYPAVGFHKARGVSEQGMVFDVGERG